MAYIILLRHKSTLLYLFICFFFLARVQYVYTTLSITTACLPTTSIHHSCCGWLAKIKLCILILIRLVPFLLPNKVQRLIAQDGHFVLCCFFTISFTLNTGSPFYSNKGHISLICVCAYNHITSADNSPIHLSCLRGGRLSHTCHSWNFANLKVEADGLIKHIDPQLPPDTSVLYI